GLAVAHEGFGLGIDLELRAQADLQLAGLDAVLLQVLHRPLEGGGILLVVLEPLAGLGHRDLATKLVGDVAQVAQGTGEVAFQDVGVEVFDLAAANGLEEVVEVVRVGTVVVGLHGLAVAVEDGAAQVVGAHQVTFGAVEDHADLGALVVFGVQTADLEDEGLVAVVVDADLGVGRVTGVLVAVAAAVAQHALTNVVDLQTPAADVHLVDALVTQVAVAVSPLPVPIVVELGPGQRQDGSRATPQIVVHAIGNGVLATGTDRLAALVAQAAGHLHLAQVAVQD